MNLQLKASKSYWLSKRDEKFSVLDILLNKSAVSDNAEEIQYRINETVREISIIMKTIEVVDILIEQNSAENTETKDNNN